METRSLKKYLGLLAIFSVSVLHNGTCGLLDDDNKQDNKQEKLEGDRGKLYILGMINEIADECIKLKKIYPDCNFEDENNDLKNLLNELAKIDPDEIDRERLQMIQQSGAKYDDINIEYNKQNISKALKMLKKIENKLSLENANDIYKYDNLDKEIKDFILNLLDKNKITSKKITDDKFFELSENARQVIILNYIYTLLGNSESILGSEVPSFFWIKELIRKAIENLKINIKS